MFFFRCAAFVPLLLSLLLLSGCAGLRHAAEGWIGREPVPRTVLGLDYSRIHELGALEGACAELGEHYRHGDGGYVSSSRLHERWLPECEARIQAARQARDKMLTALVEQAYRAQHAAEVRRARQREARAARRAAEQAKSRQASIAASASPEPPQQARQVAQRRQLANAHIREVLDQVPDQPLAYAVGQPSGRSMKDFLACLEVGYPNHGYQVKRSDGTLVVIAEGADIQRDRVDIRARFVNVWDTWVLESLSVAEIKAITPRERFLLARNLLQGPSC